tara:strand:+ start:4852 stop:5223 length:372 start_codon:yes stop_codon:yes gene_type:complete
MRRILIDDAIRAIHPDAQFTTVDGVITEWKGPGLMPSQDELDTKLKELKENQPYKLLREERNRLIAETDWTQLKDIDLDIIRERNWKNYRQALRDLPAKSNPKLNSYGDLDMSSVTWPDKPSL